MSEAPSVWPLGLYAPGKYICKCAICEKQFDGDKRAVQCLECAVRHLRISAEAAECKVVELEEERDEARISLGEAEHHLSNLLARIHRDGGHYEADHGAVKAAEDADKIVANLYAAEADKARLSEALRTFESYGCPVCGGDCASANPPVMFCPMQAARVALSGSGSGWRLVPNGEPVTLDDCPEGLFLFNGNLGFMTEYTTEKNDGFQQRDAYCGDSGEYFWGGASSARERAKLIVQPMLPAAPQQGGE